MSVSVYSSTPSTGRGIRNPGGTYGERVECEPIRRSGSGAPSGVQGQSPWWRSRGEAPLKLKAFELLTNFPWNSKIYPVFHILLFVAVLTICYLAFITMLQNCYSSRMKNGTLYIFKMTDKTGSSNRSS